MSRLRRLVVSDRFFFITCRLLPHRRVLAVLEFECMARVVRERREKHHDLNPVRGPRQACRGLVPQSGIERAGLYRECEHGGRKEEPQSL